MALPFVIAALVATKAIETGSRIFSDRKAAKYSEQEGHMERELFGRNAELAEKQAEDAIARGDEAVLRERRQARQLTGAQRSAYAGQGVNVSSGSALQVQESDRALSEYDTLMIRENAAREALGYTMEADIQRERGELAFRAAKNRAKGLRNSTFNSLANFGGDMFDLYLSNKRGEI